MRTVSSNLVRVILSLLPAALVLGFIWMSFGASIADFMPHYDVDQYIYWHEMATYALHGFKGGYYGVNEMLSPLKGFGPHGVGIAMVYGFFYGLLPGSGFAIIPVINISLLTLALGAYVWFASPGLGKATVVSLAVSLYPPLFLYLPTSFQDGLHCAFAIVLAMLFIRLISNGRQSNQLAFRVAVGIFLLVLCFVRYTWAVCFLPYFYIIMVGRRWRLPLAIALTLAISIAVVWFFSQFVPTWYSSPQSGVHVSGALLSDRLTFMLERAMANLRSLVDYTNNRAAAAVLAGGVAFTALGMAAAWRMSSWTRDELSPGAVVFLIIATNMAGLLAVFIVAWTGSGSHVVRLLSANYLFCFIVTFHIFPWRVFHGFVAYNATLLPLYLGIFQVYHLPGYINSDVRRLIKEVSGKVSPHLQPSVAASPWDKTIFVDVPERGIAYLSIPAGFGIQTTDGRANNVHRLSRYALTTSQPGSRGQAPWIPLVETAIGTLYANPSVGNETSQIRKEDVP